MLKMTMVKPLAEWGSNQGNSIKWTEECFG